MKDAITVVICALSLAYVLKDSVCRWMDRKEASLHRQMKEQGYL